MLGEVEQKYTWKLNKALFLLSTLSLHHIKYTKKHMFGILNVETRSGDAGAGRSRGAKKRMRRGESGMEQKR
jgi:hypothetical protein